MIIGKVTYCDTALAVINTVYPAPHGRFNHLDTVPVGIKFYQAAVFKRGYVYILAFINSNIYRFGETEAVKITGII